MRSRSNALLLLAVSSLLLSGCATEPPDPTPMINDLGTFLFLAFCLVVVFSLVLPRLQKTRLMRNMREIIRKPTILIAYGIQVVGIYLVIVFFADPSTRFIFSLIGAVMVVGGYYLLRWARNRDPEHTVSLKIVAIALSTILALLWLIYFAASTINF